MLLRVTPLTDHGSTATLLALLVLGLLTSPAAGDTRIVFIQPGGPGSTEKAQPVMSDFAAALGIPGARAIYFNNTDEANKYIQTHKPAFGIVSLDFYLSQRKALQLEPLAQALPGGRKTTTYSLLARKGDDQPRRSLTGIGLSNPRFLTRVLKLKLGKWRLIPARSPLRAIRDVVRKKADLVLLDQDAAQALDKLPRYAALLRLIQTTAPVPSAPVVRFADRGEKTQLLPALLRLSKDPKHKKLLESFKLSGFSSVTPGTYKTVVQAYEPPKK